MSVNLGDFDDAGPGDGLMPPDMFDDAGPGDGLMPPTQAPAQSQPKGNKVTAALKKYAVKKPRGFKGAMKHFHKHGNLNLPDPKQRGKQHPMYLTVLEAINKVPDNDTKNELREIKEWLDGDYALGGFGVKKFAVDGSSIKIEQDEDDYGEYGGRRRRRRRKSRKGRKSRRKSRKGRKSRKSKKTKRRRRRRRRK